MNTGVGTLWVRMAICTNDVDRRIRIFRGPGIRSCRDPVPQRNEPAYGSRVDTRARALAITASVEAIFLGFAALVAFLTPSGASEHNLVLTAALLCLAAPLAWHAASTLRSGTPPADAHMRRVALPNALLLLMCFSVLQSPSDGYGLWPSLVAVLAVAVIVAALRLTRERVPSPAGI